MLAALAAGCRSAEEGSRAPLPGAAPFPAALARRLAAAAARHDPRDPPRSRHRNPDGTPRYTNRLILETSPYLLQHAHNPVDWHAWGEEAFATAAREKKPILLSVGYSTCHWCHVMEEESFEDEAIATTLNRRYVAIKVDREERPDVDGVYLAVVQRMTGGGGWPLTVWLTPDRLPFYGGTYFPPRDGMRGMPTGFQSLLEGLAGAYAESPGDVTEKAAAFAKRLAAEATPARGDLPGAGAIRAAVAALGATYDAAAGGFGDAPKFPRPSTLELLLRYHRRTGAAGVLGMVTTTLERMAAGGIYDQLGGGFHRYAVDAEWRVPHFEKMLYDNAQLVLVYLEAFQATRREDFAQTARETLDYVAREMTSPEGAFYTATDADSDGEEGTYFVWTPDEIDTVLGDDGSLVRAYFDVTPAGNFARGASVLWRPRPLAEVATAAGVSPERLEAVLRAARPTLLAARGRRAPPATDRKILVAWNGLMLSAFARGALVLGDERYLARARQAGALLLERGRRRGRLAHAIGADGGVGAAFLDDYAFVIAGLLDLLEVDTDARWLREALALQHALDAEFADSERGGYFFTAAGHEALLVREKPDYDGALPAGNSVAALNLLRLAEYTGDARHRERAAGVFHAFGAVLARLPAAMPRLLVALDYHLDRAKEIVVVAPDGGGAERLGAVLRTSFVPNRIVLSITEQGTRGALARLAPVLRDKVALGGEPTAYVCEAMRCDLPTRDPAVFAQQLATVAPLPE